MGDRRRKVPTDNGEWTRRQAWKQTIETLQTGWEWNTWITGLTTDASPKMNLEDQIIQFYGGCWSKTVPLS